jgi:hypothetical protein
VTFASLGASLRSLVREERDAYLLGLIRVLLAVLLATNVWARFDELEHWTYFGDVFHLPLVPESWVPSRANYILLLWVELGGAFLAFFGLLGREGLAVAATTGLYLLACDRLQYHNNRFALLLACFLCAFMPSDRSFLLYRGRRHALPLEGRIAPTLPRRLLQLQVSAIYLSSGGGKLFDPDWRGGQSMLVRFEEGVAYARQHGAPIADWYASFLTSPLTASLASKAAISLELFLAAGLWVPRLRAFALWAGVIFHLMIQASARVELFSWLMGVAYVAFVTPELRERTVRVNAAKPLGRAVALVLPWLDWLARFRIEAQPAGKEAAVVAVDRDGREARGLGVPGILARGLPAAYLAWPLLAVLGRSRPRLTDP